MANSNDLKGSFGCINYIDVNRPKIFDSAQKAKIDFEVALIGKLIEVRESKGLSQKEFADLAGLKQPAIARLESMKATPQIDTLSKILQPLYTLAVVPSGQHQK